MSKKRKVVFTCTNDYKDTDYKVVWDKIVKDKLEEMYGKIK